VSDDEAFNLYFNSDILKRVQDDRDAFIETLKGFFDSHATAWDCRLTISYRRLGEAYDFWRADVDRTLAKGIAGETTELDHFQHAAFIAFWLRRAVPINDIWWVKGSRSEVVESSLPTVQHVAFKPSNEQAFFARYGNELCSLSAGYYVCLAYEAAPKQADTEVGNVEKKLLAAAPGRRFLFEFPKLLKHKNMSAHGLYMMYYSMFQKEQHVSA